MELWWEGEQPIKHKQDRRSKSVVRAIPVFFWLLRRDSHSPHSGREGERERERDPVWIYFHWRVKNNNALRFEGVSGVSAVHLRIQCSKMVNEQWERRKRLKLQLGDLRSTVAVNLQQSKCWFRKQRSNWVCLLTILSCPQSEPSACPAQPHSQCEVGLNTQFENNITYIRYFGG